MQRLRASSWSVGATPPARPRSTWRNRAARSRSASGATTSAKSMSRYLIERIDADPRIEVLTSTEVRELDGDRHLERVTLEHTPIAASDGRSSAPALFCFIGADPATEWLDGLVALDPGGFVLTDRSLPAPALESGRVPRARAPAVRDLGPGVFAVGDVRHGSLKRVAAAVGEGSSAVRSVHRAPRIGGVSCPHHGSDRHERVLRPVRSSCTRGCTDATDGSGDASRGSRASCSPPPGATRARGASRCSSTPTTATAASSSPPTAVPTVRRGGCSTCSADPSVEVHVGDETYDANWRVSSTPTTPTTPGSGSS